MPSPQRLGARPRRASGRSVAAAAALLWIALVPFANAQRLDELSYDAYHRLMTVPLLLFVVAWALLRARLHRVPWAVLLLGLVLYLGGNVLEFWGVLLTEGENANVVGGVGAWWGSHAGWIAFILGFVTSTVGGSQQRPRSGGAERWRGGPLSPPSSWDPPSWPGSSSARRRRPWRCPSSASAPPRGSPSPRRGARSGASGFTRARQPCVSPSLPCSARASCAA